MPNNLRRQYNNTSNPSAQARAFGWRSLLCRPGLRPAALRPTRPRSGPAAVRFDLAADPRNLNPLFPNPDAASVEQQVARLVFEPFVDLDARGRPVPALLQAIPTRANGGLSADGRTIRYRLRRSVLWSDGSPGNRAGRPLHAARDPRSAQSGALARRLRPDRPRLRADPAYRRLSSQARVGAGGDDLLLVRVLAAVRLAGARAARRRRRSRARRSTQRRASATGRTGSSPGGAAKGCATRQTRATGAEGRAVATLDVRIVPDPSTNLLLLQSGAARLEPARAGAARRICAATPGIAFLTVPTAVVAGPRVQYAARAARRRARAAGACDVDRSRRDLAKDHARVSIP